jgi:osmotically-inducible protein OsmY
MLSTKLFRTVVLADMVAVATPVPAQDRPASVAVKDAWITTKVQSKYYLDPDVNGLAIDVTTNGGVVTLTGKVSSAAERQRALALAKATDGVKQVIDKLSVGK